jgi:hypothetical protein
MSEMEQKPAAQRDADMIAATLAAMDAPEKPAAPPPKSVPKPVRVRRQPEPVIATAPEDDDWDSLPDAGDDDAPASVGARVGTSKAATAPTHAPAPVPIVPAIPAEIVYGPHGFPDINADQELIRVTGNVTRLEASLREATVQAEQSAAALGLKLGQSSQGKIDRIAAELLAAGKPLDDIDLYEERWRLVRRLTDALGIATAAVTPARERARVRLQAAAQEPLRPTYAAMQKARAEFVKTVLRHQDMIAFQRGAGFDRGNEWSSIVTAIPIYRDEIRAQFGPLVANGTLTPDDVAGLPGF